ncbi:MAG: UDP-N-acetylmuramoyl-L-alanyl-D-glutamate--2,6-diaminopimelate ligase [Thermoleophilia bacterium]|nr:UDP-N-acetylmuramoyl-L-alanyl-D-glutamate--2,6-diaminopimelate ligase [Thermoleophilia bacterium]
MPQLSDIIEALPNVTLHGDATGVNVSNVAMDTRRIHPGALFFCVPGASLDGHDFAAEAVANGAVALVVERHLPEVDILQVQVETVRGAMGPISDAFFEQPSRRLPVFGVTGTNGKTTTTFLLRAMLEAAGKQAGVIGTTGITVGGEERVASHTTPEALDLHGLLYEMVSAGDDAAAIEISSHALDQHRSRNVRYAAVGFTNLTRDHLDYHRSFEAYYQAKRLLFTEPGPEGQFFPAAVNCDDEWGSRLFDELVHAERGDVPVWGWTLREMNRASVSASFALTADGASIKVESPVGDFALRSRLRGRFNVENVLTAATMALLAGLTPDDVQAGLDSVPGVRGRFEPVEAGQAFTVLVDYAHTPDSLEQVLTSAREFCDRELIVVFGCGGDRDRSKRPLMGRAASNGADVAIVTSDNPRSEDPTAIIAEIKRGMRGEAELVELVDRRAAIQHAISLAKPGDVVLIAGKGHEQGQTFADETVPFDDVTVAREALEAAGVS